MRMSKQQWRRGTGWAVAFAAILVAGCSSDTPTKPQQTPSPAPSPGPSVAWNVTVSANPAQLTAGSPVPSLVTVTVRRSDNGQPPPDNATALISTTFGDFNSQRSGIRSGTLNLLGGLAQLELFAGDNPGSAQIQARIESSIGGASVAFVDTAVFFLQGVSPATGRPVGGETLQISGGGFKGPVRVVVGGVVAQVLELTDSLIRAVTPSFSVPVAGSVRVDIQVTNELGTPQQLTDTLAGVFTYVSDITPETPIQVHSVSPASGLNEGGTRVVITGQGFQSPVQVLFGTGTTAAAFSGVEAIVESVTATEIVARTPAATGFGQSNRDQEVNVLVRNRTSGTGSVLQRAFRYGPGILITSISPSIGPPSGNQRVTIFGQGFDEPVAVSIAGVGGQRVISVTGTEVIFLTQPIQLLQCTDISGVVSATNIETGASALGPIYTFDIDSTLPLVTAVNPTLVAAAGGTAVTATGSNFSQPIRVTIDGAVAPVDSVTPTAIVLRTPAIDVADLQVEPCDDDGDGKLGERYIDTRIDQTLEVTLLASGCSDSISVGFTYQPADRTCRADTVAPVANFTFLVAGSIATFTDTSTGAPTSWQWDFGDGETSTARNPQHTYPTPAAGTSQTFTVTLTVSNSKGSSTKSQNVTIQGPVPPTASFTAFVAGTTATFTDTSTGAPTDWQWDFGDGSGSSARNTSNTYATPAAGTSATYTVTLTVSNANGSSSASQNITIQGPAVIPPPSASFTALVAGSTVTFTNTSTGTPPLNFLWNFGTTPATTSTAQNPSKTYTAAGTYTVTLTATNPGGSSNAAQNVTLNAPVASFSASTAAGMKATFIDTSTGNPTTWLWDFGDGFGSPAQNPPQKTHAAAGVYTVRLTVTRGGLVGFSSTTVQNVTVPP